MVHKRKDFPLFPSDFIFQKTCHVFYNQAQTLAQTHVFLALYSVFESSLTFKFQKKPTFKNVIDYIFIKNVLNIWHLKDVLFMPAHKIVISKLGMTAKGNQGDLFFENTRACSKIYYADTRNDNCVKCYLNIFHEFILSICMYILCLQQLLNKCVNLNLHL